MAREGGPVSLSDAWRAWVAENLLLGIPPRELLGTLERSGVPRAVGIREIEAIRRSSLMAGARRVARLVRAQELVGRLWREVDKLGREGPAVARRSGMPFEEFVDRYYAASTPVVLTDAMLGWPALSRWSPAYLKERFGEAEVEVTSDREDDPHPDANYAAHSRMTRLGEFCDRVVSAGSTNDFYLVANNRIWMRSGLDGLFEDLRPPHAYLDDRRGAGWTSMWFGPAGTVTPLHHDTANVLFCQVFGRKKVILVPPFELSLLRNLHHGVYSEVDAENPDLDAFPEFAEVSRREVVLCQGEALFIPVGWWHHVRALEVSINLAFTNFRAPNQFEWYFPGRVR
jgi:hypothetical protein